MTLDELLRYSLQKEAQEKCTLEIKERLWRRLAVALNLKSEMICGVERNS